MSFLIVIVISLWQSPCFAGTSRMVGARSFEDIQPLSGQLSRLIRVDYRSTAIGKARLGPNNLLEADKIETLLARIENAERVRPKRLAATPLEISSDRLALGSIVARLREELSAYGAGEINSMPAENIAALSARIMDGVDRADGHSVEVPESNHMEPWALTRLEWRDVGSPDLNIDWSQRRRGRPPWADSLYGEIYALNRYFSLFPNLQRVYELGGLPDSARFQTDRQPQFATSRWAYQYFSHFPGYLLDEIADARELIIVGRKLGILEADILYCMIRSYVVGPFFPKIKIDAFPAGDKIRGEVQFNVRVPKIVKRIFPALAEMRLF